MEDNLSLISKLFKSDWKKKKDYNVDGKASILIEQSVDKKEMNF